VNVRLILFAALLVVLTYNEAARGQNGDTTPLRTLAEARGIAIGTAVAAVPLRDDSQYAETLRREFNLVTTETELKMDVLRPNRDTYDFSHADTIIEFAEANEMRVRGHTLVWHDALPGWLTGGNFSRDELVAILRDHIHTVVRHYRGRVDYWDVVNEAMGDDGNLRDSFWLRGIGPEYIEYAFTWAREADPDALLFYNDYGAETMNDKSNAIYEMLGDLVLRDIPVDGIGLQMHVSLGDVPDMERVRANMVTLEALRLEVHITEMDVAVYNGTGTDAQRLDAQAVVYRDALRTCLSVDACTTFSTWGFTDRHTWIPQVIGRPDAPLPFDADYQPKPAYWSLAGALGDTTNEAKR
jgi:endo-1,4-beta-xylanase